MTFLEFIRKNSLLVLIVILAIGAGLLMMDYGNQGSTFSRDFHIQVNGTNYAAPEVYSMGESASGTIQNLVSATHTKLRNRFDANGDEELSTDEQAAMSAWIQENPQFEAALTRLQYIMEAWCYGLCKNAEENIAINRAVLHEEAKALGVFPSKEQIDAYITSMPAFINADGSFDQKLYQNLTGYYDGVANNPVEQSFRNVIADIIIWETIGSLVTTDVTYNSKAQSEIVDVSCQSIKGKTAWLPTDKIQAPAEPTEEEVKAYWDTNKEKYKSEQRRIVSVYTLTPGKDVTIDSLMNTADSIMMDLSMANGVGIDNILENTANNPEHFEFTYKNEDGSTHTTLPLSTAANAPALLQTEVAHNGKNTTLAAIAFNDVDSASTVAAYEEAVKNGTADKLSNIQQYRGFYLTNDNKLILIKVEAIEQPSVLPYEQARAAALADLKQERADNALTLAAEKLYKEMSEAIAAGEGLDAAYTKATAAGAEVSDFGPVTLDVNEQLPEGMSTKALTTTATGKLCPLVVLTNGARISSVTERTVPQTTEYNFAKLMYLMPRHNALLSNQVMLDWLNTAYIRYNVILADSIKTNAE